MNVVVVGCGSHREFGLHSLRAAGHTVGVIDSLDRIPVDAVDWFAWVSPRDLTAIRAALQASHIQWDALLCWDEMSVEVMPALAEATGLPAPRMHAAHFRDKALMRSILKAGGFLTPAFAAVAAPEEAHVASRGMSWPLVLKPSDYGGSSGVKLVHTAAELDEAFRQAIAKSPRKKCILEEYVEGPEFSVETVTWAGGRHLTFGVTQKRTTAPPYFVELGHSFPASLEARDEAEIVAFTHSVLDALGMEVGASHAEVKITARGPVLIEVAGRLGGDMIPNLVSLSTGMNPYLCELEAVLDEPFPGVRKGQSRSTSAIQFFVAPPGSVLAWPDLAAFQRDESLRAVLRDLKYWYPAGVPTPELNSNSKRLGYCVVHGSRSQVSEALRVLAPLFG